MISSTKAVNSPNSSTPTSPPPMTTNVSSDRLRSGSVSTSARSNRSIRWLRSSEGVGEGLEREGVLRAGDHLLVGHRPEGENELVVRQLVRFALQGRHVDRAPVQVDALDGGLDEPGGPQERADGQRAVPHLQGAGTDLEEQRVHEEEVVAAHEDDLDVGPPSQSFSRWRAV